MSLPENILRLSRASRDFAEVQTVYRGLGPRVMCSDIRESISLILTLQEDLKKMHSRINEIRNSRDTMLVEVQDCIKRFDFTMREV